MKPFLIAGLGAAACLGVTMQVQAFTALPHSHDLDHRHSAPLILAGVTTSIEDGYRYIESDGLPDHQTGAFPNRNNPNSISAQSYRFRLPLNPVKNAEVTGTGMNWTGVAMNGVPFEPGTAERWDPETRSLRRGGPPTGWTYEAMGGGVNVGIDPNNAHVQRNGAYHYHGIPSGDMKGLTPHQVGWAADGFPMLYAPQMTPSYQLKPGMRPADGPTGAYDGTFTEDWAYVAGLGQLDECNGADVPSLGYAYFVTETFPYVGRCLHGTPDKSFEKPRGQRRNRGAGQRQN